MKKIDGIAIDEKMYNIYENAKNNMKDVSDDWEKVYDAIIKCIHKSNDEANMSRQGAVIFYELEKHFKVFEKRC